MNQVFKDWEMVKERHHHVCQKCFKKEPEIELTLGQVLELLNGEEDKIKKIKPLCKNCY